MFINIYFFTQLKKVMPKTRAIVLTYIANWCRHNNDKGRYINYLPSTYTSSEELAAKLDFGVRTIKRHIAALRDDGYIFSGHMGSRTSTHTNRTNWYCVTAKAVDAILTDADISKLESWHNLKTVVARHELKVDQTNQIYSSGKNDADGSSPVVDLDSLSHRLEDACIEQLARDAEAEPNLNGKLTFTVETQKKEKQTVCTEVGGGAMPDEEFSGALSWVNDELKKRGGFDYFTDPEKNKEACLAVYKACVDVGLVKPNTSITFMTRDWGNGVNNLKIHKISIDELLEAIANYGVVRKLVKAGATWWSAWLTFEQFTRKSILKFVPSVFDVKLFTDGEINLEQIEKDAAVKDLEDAMSAINTSGKSSAEYTAEYTKLIEQRNNILYDVDTTPAAASITAAYSELKDEAAQMTAEEFSAKMQEKMAGLAVVQEPEAQAGDALVQEPVPQPVMADPSNFDGIKTIGQGVANTMQQLGEAASKNPINQNRASSAQHVQQREAERLSREEGKKQCIKNYQQTGNFLNIEIDPEKDEEMRLKWDASEQLRLSTKVSSPSLMYMHPDWEASKNFKFHWDGMSATRKNYMDNLQDVYKAIVSGKARSFYYIYGPPGTSKTFFGLWLARTLLMTKRLRDIEEHPDDEALWGTYSVDVTTHDTVVDDYIKTKSYRPDLKFKDFETNLWRPDVLIYDELGKYTDYKKQQENHERDILYILADKRCRAGQVTIMLSNLPVSEFGRKLSGDPILSRFMRNDMAMIVSSNGCEDLRLLPPDVQEERFRSRQDKEDGNED